MKRFGQWILVGYSAVLTTVVAASAVSAQAAHKPVQFDEIRVHRIDVVEPDGTLRMVISNKSRLPGVIVRGKEQPPADRPQAGMIFYNDEGSENGGLVFGGRKNAKGEVVDSGGSLSFDKYGENQIVQLAGVDGADAKFAGLAVSDQRQRLWVGRMGDGSAAVALMDVQGHRRIVLQVASDGASSIRFLDADGHVLQELAPR